MVSPDSSAWADVEAILDRRIPLAVASTGGGSLLGAWLLNHPGASRAVLEVQIPYHARALEAFLGGGGPYPVVAETARRMALAAYIRARDFSGEDAAMGLGCTAALVTNRVRRGEERAFLALRTESAYACCAVRFEKGRATRQEQEYHLSRTALDQILAASEDVAVIPSSAVADASVSRYPVHDELEALLDGRVDQVVFETDGRISTMLDPPPTLLFPGSFNPLHQGHVELAAAAEARTGAPVCLELSVENVDKPSLSYGAVLDRLEGLKGRYRVVLSRAATFAAKARMIPRSWMLVGYDTAVRLLAPRYYEGGKAGLDDALTFFSANGVRFLVAGRAQEGAFRTLADLPVPDGFGDLFDGLEESDFRSDLSSTELRLNSGTR